MRTPTVNTLPLLTTPTTSPQMQQMPKQHTMVAASQSRTPKDAMLKVPCCSAKHGEQAEMIFGNGNPNPAYWHEADGDSGSGEEE